VAGRPFEAGALAEYKGPGYAEHLLKNDTPWQRGMRGQLFEQALSQVRAAGGGRSLTWFVAEKPLADYLTEWFEAMRLPIAVEWLPYPARSR
jgi:hypothetical protein